MSKHQDDLIKSIDFANEFMKVVRGFKVEHDRPDVRDGADTDIPNPADRDPAVFHGERTGTDEGAGGPDTVLGIRRARGSGTHRRA